MRRYSLRDRSFDAVVSVSSFHYWPDPMAGLAEVRRVLRPAGQFVVTDWCDDFLACRLCDRWLRLTRRSYRQIYGSRECERYLQRAGFRIQRVDRYKIGRLWGIMTVTALSP
jgi:SAM-dependent methyltransferase